MLLSDWLIVSPCLTWLDSGAISNLDNQYSHLIAIKVLFLPKSVGSIGPVSPYNKVTRANIFFLEDKTVEVRAKRR